VVSRVEPQHSLTGTSPSSLRNLPQNRLFTQTTKPILTKLVQERKKKDDGLKKS